MKKVILEVKNEVAWLTINRPEKRNAIDYDVMELFNEMLTIAEERTDVKALVVTGSGTEAFCSGGDLSVFHELYTKVEAEKMLNKMANVLLRLFFFPKPTIAYLNGTAVGGGCEIATACDFRIAAKNVKLGFIQGKLGITTGWGGSTYLLERISRNEAIQLLMTAEVFDTEKALRVGFVDYIYDNAELHNWLSRFTKQDLGVLLAYKRHYSDKYDKELIHNRVLAEIDNCSSLWETPEHHDAVARFINK